MKIASTKSSSYRIPPKKPKLSTLNEKNKNQKKNLATREYSKGTCICEGSCSSFPVLPTDQALVFLCVGVKLEPHSPRGHGVSTRGVPPQHVPGLWKLIKMDQEMCQLEMQRQVFSNKPH